MNLAVLLVVIGTGGAGASPATTIERFPSNTPGGSVAACERLATAVTQRHHLSGRPGNILAFCISEGGVP